MLRWKTKAMMMGAGVGCPLNVAALNLQVLMAVIACWVRVGTSLITRICLGLPELPMVTSSTTVPCATLFAGYFAKDARLICGGVNCAASGFVGCAGARTKLWYAAPPAGLKTLKTTVREISEGTGLPLCRAGLKVQS